MSPPPHPHPVHPKIWQSCAGPAVTIPKLHSKVYYFPLGHLEHACPFPNPNTISIIDNNHRPSIPCIISAVDLLSDPHTDEVFAKLILTPITNSHVQEQEPPVVVPDDQEDDDGDKVVSYIKILTQSDSNNGGGFSVPRECADLILPALDFTDPMPSQELYVNDVHGGVWKYTHVYRGKPKRHLFTTGWTPFVNGKKLVAGDTVVFLKKNSTGNLFVGIRRNMKFAAAEAAAAAQKKKEEGDEKVEGFTRNGKRGNVTEEAVVEAVERAEKSMAFEVVYYPTSNWSDFVVETKVVDEAMKIGWESGMRVKLLLKKEKCSKKPLSQPQGTISNVSIVPNWRMLKVNWDEPEISQYPNSVNPWQVELISQAPALYLPFLQTKRPRLTVGDPFNIPMIEFPYSTIGSFNQTLFNCDSFPAGMQGARHNHLSAASTSSSNFFNYNGYGLFVNSRMTGLSTLPKEINIGNSTSVDSSSSPQTNYVETHNDNTERVNVKPSSIKLFGKIIHIVESDFHDSSIKGSEDGSNGCSEIEGVDKTCATNIAQ